MSSKPMLLLLFLLSIFTVHADIHVSEHGGLDFFRGRMLMSTGTDDQHSVYEKELEKTTLVVLSSGTMVLVEKDSGRQLWSLKTGAPMSSSSLAYRDDDDDDDDDVTELDDMIRIDPTILRNGNSGETNLVKIIQDYFGEWKKQSKDTTSVMETKETLFVVNARSGKLLAVIDPSRMMNALSDEITNPNNDVLYIKRIDITYKVYSVIENTVLWNIKFSTIEMISIDQGKGPRLNVVHFYSRDAGFIQLLKSKDKMLSLPPGGNENLMRLLEGGNSDSLMPPLEGGIYESLTPSLEGENRPHTEGWNIRNYMTVFSIMMVLISVALLLGCIYTRNEMKQKSTSVSVGSSGQNPSPHNRKKGQKVANTKIGDVENFNGTSSDKKDRKEQWPSPGMPLGAKANGRMIGKLYISCTEIAKGSNGTVIMEGVYDGRPVAVKRLVQAHHDIAHKEVQNLIASDQHPNIVRYHGVEYDPDFVYLSLERCSCNLSDLIKICSKSTSHLASNRGKCSISAKDCNDQLDILKENNRSIELWKANKYPSPELLRLMRDVVSGLEHLHELGIIHRDLKPQNILIIHGKFLCAKLSDMGISKRLLEDKSSLDCRFTGYGSSGWQAPEQLLHGRQTRAMDMFSLGCVLFFCLTGGSHPFGDHLERDINIVKNRVDLFLVDYIPEAVDLFSRLLDPNPELRPTAKSVLHHPLFWSSDIRLSFLRDVSDRVELGDREADSDILKALENIGPVALGGNWDEKMETKFIDDIGRYRRYKYDSTRDLLRVMRNKLNHYRETPKDIQEILGAVPDGFDAYFASRFPKFLIEVYKVICGYCREEECFRKYFETV